MVKKITQIIIVLVLLFAIPLAASAQMALAWDEYTDSTATYLRLESSLTTNPADFSTLVNDIARTAIGVAVPNHTTDNERVYYRIVAYNSGFESGPSNTVSFFWTTGGGGQEGLLKPGDIHFVDCSNPQSGEEQFCLDIGASNSD